MSQIVNVTTLPTDRPLLLIDVDGVLNAINKNQNHKRYDIFTAEGYPIRMGWYLADWMWELTNHFIPVWCTTWDEDANTYFADRLRMPFLPVIPTSEARGRGFSGDKPPLLDPIPYVHWKMPAIVEYVENRPYAFIDDEITNYDHGWAKERTKSGIPTKMIKTDMRQGMLRHHVDKLIAWSASLKG